MALGLSSRLAAAFLLTVAGVYLVNVPGDEWCFYNPDSINGPFVTARHWSLAGVGIMYTTTSELQEPGWQCTTVARAVHAEKTTFKGPARCRSLIPISVHHYWNVVTIQPGSAMELDTNCSSCAYSDVPVGGPWPQIACSQLPPRSRPGLLGHLLF